MLLCAAVAVFLAPEPARAQVPRSAVCDYQFGANTAKSTEAIQAWMNTQLAAGKTEFMTTAGGVVVCAW